MAPSDVVIELVQEPTESLAEEATEVFAHLMKSDPAAIALSGGDLSLIPASGRAMIRSLVLCPGVSHMFTARDQTGALAGFTIFSLPGQLMFSTDEQREKGNLMEFMGMLSSEGRAYFEETMGKEVPKANDEAFGIEDSERNTYWCNFAMVRQDYQGKGIAKAMFARAFEEAAKLQATIALTTTNVVNVPIYEKIGLQPFGDSEKVMQSPWIEWRLWFFAKKPSVQAARES